MSSLALSPSEGGIGTVVSLTGTGLQRRTHYGLSVVGGPFLCKFETTAQGKVPRGISFKIPTTPAAGERGELGSALNIRLVPLDKQDPVEGSATLPFKMLSSLRLDRESAAVGQKVVIVGLGLLPSEYYFVSVVRGTDPDVAVGLFTSDPDGTGKSEFIVPDTFEPGMFTIQVKNRRGNYLALREPPRLKLAGYSNRSLTPGRPQPPRAEPFCTALVRIPFDNHLAIPVTATVYAVISRPDGAFRITSGGMILATNGSGEALICFAGLPHGSYRVEAFAAMLTGAILSKRFSFRLKV